VERGGGAPVSAPSPFHLSPVWRDPRSLEALARGDPPTWNRLAEEGGPALEGAALAVTRSRSLAQDAVQSTWETAYRHASGPWEPSLPQGLERLARAHALQLARQHGRRHVVARAEAQGTLVSFPASEEEMAPEEALAILPPGPYEAFLLTQVLGQEAPDAAQFLGVDEERWARWVQTARHLWEAQFPRRRPSLSSWAGPSLPSASALRLRWQKTWEGAQGASYRLRRQRTVAQGAVLAEEWQCRYVAPDVYRLEGRGYEEEVHGQRRLVRAQDGTQAESHMPAPWQGPFAPAYPRLGHLWSRPGLLTVGEEATAQGEVWLHALWQPSHEEAVHLWVHPDDDTLRRLEVWDPAQGRILKVALEEVRLDPPLPPDPGHSEGPRTSEGLLGAR
jgi:DNA-directed RNA polymerase specialized sigma24 family protein